MHDFVNHGIYSGGEWVGSGHGDSRPRREVAVHEVINRYHDSGTRQLVHDLVHHGSVQLPGLRAQKECAGPSTVENRGRGKQDNNFKRTNIDRMAKRRNKNLGEPPTGILRKMGLQQGSDTSVLLLIQGQTGTLPVQNPPSLTHTNTYPTHTCAHQYLQRSVGVVLPARVREDLRVWQRQAQCSNRYSEGLGT